jgi:hypothetical protein
MKRQVFKTRKHQDPLLHMRYNPFLRSRAQAWYLLQDWTLTFEEYCGLWTVDHWYCRGRGISDLVMIREDVEKGWTKENCLIVTRKEQLSRTRFRTNRNGKNLNGTHG